MSEVSELYNNLSYWAFITKFSAAFFAISILLIVRSSKSHTPIILLAISSVIMLSTGLKHNNISRKIATHCENAGGIYVKFKCATMIDLEAPNPKEGE